MVLDIFALVVIAVLISVVIWLVVLLGNLPGEIARKRKHPQADAITALGWIGLITMGISWFVAIIWHGSFRLMPFRTSPITFC